MTKNTGSRITGWIRWIARILGGLVATLILVYTVGGIPHIIEHLNPRQYINPITLFLSALGLIIAWRREGLGGAISVIFILINLVAGRWLLSLQDPPYIQLFIFAIPGILFLYCWWQSRNRKTDEHSD